MKTPDELAREHLATTRRYFMKLSAAGAAGAWTSQLGLFAADDAKARDALAKAIAELPMYLTLSENFRNVERHRPLPYKLPYEERLEAGLERETWKLEVIPDPDSDSRLRNPLTKEDGNALDFPALMKLAEKHATRYLKVMTCNNLADPLGMGLWEGVPLREVIWMAQPDQNVRRLFYRGYHNNDPEQIFQSSLPIGRVLEDPPGEHPVILCYKLNGKPLTGERGGPVRMIVPDAYGFKSIKWLQTIYLTNDHQANDTYAEKNNDVDSAMKSYARFVNWPGTDKKPEALEVKPNEPIPLTGVAQAGMSGLSKVQYWIAPDDEPPPVDDRYFTSAPWMDAEILPPPERWGEMLEKIPAIPGQTDAAGKPLAWPPRHTIAHWAALAPGLPRGKYKVRCRTIDANGVAQPMPRPFQKSGGNKIQMVMLEVG